MSKKIMLTIKKWKAEAKATRVVQFSYNNGILRIYTSEPGSLVGKRGVLGYKYINIFKKMLPGFKKLELIETDYYWG